MNLLETLLFVTELCARDCANLTESEIVKMILKNIKPHLASQLRSRVFTVEELVKLGHQIEKDYEQQQRYESSLPHICLTTSISKPAIGQGFSSVLAL